MCVTRYASARVSFGMVIKTSEFHSIALRSLDKGAINRLKVDAVMNCDISSPVAGGSQGVICCTSSEHTWM